MLQTRYPSAMNEELKKLVEKTKADLKMPEEVKERIEYRTAPLIIAECYGSARLHRAYVALPDHMNVVRITELRANYLNAYLKYLYDFTVGDLELWKTPVGKMLIESFVLSDRAKKFLIARQAYMADNENAFHFAPIFFLLTYLFYLSTDIIQKKNPNASNAGKLFLCGISFACLFTNFRLLRYMKLQQMHNDADAKALTRGVMNKEKLNEAAARGEQLPVDAEYFEGALEYYSKEIQRHRSIRQLIKKQSNAWFFDGSGQFTEDGDYRRSSFSVDPFPSRSLKNIVNWKYNRQSED
jgi:hypothetical protein